MILADLRDVVCKVNADLVKSGLVTLTWGNASGFDPDRQMMVIKPSGISYEELKPSDMVVVDIAGNVVEGKLKPSSDTPTHLELYRSFKGIGGVVHTHSRYATAWAQSGRNIPAMGTTHADHFYGDIPCTRKLTEGEVAAEYERNTGVVIVERFTGLDPIAIPGVVVNDHGPFTWGADPVRALQNAIALEEVAAMAFISHTISGNDPIDGFLLDKHYLRKHGADSYYGQKKGKG